MTDFLPFSGALEKADQMNAGPAGDKEPEGKRPFPNSTVEFPASL